MPFATPVLEQLAQLARYALLGQPHSRQRCQNCAFSGDADHCGGRSNVRPLLSWPADNSAFPARIWRSTRGWTCKVAEWRSGCSAQGAAMSLQMARIASAPQPFPRPSLAAFSRNCDG